MSTFWDRTRRSPGAHRVRAATISRPGTYAVNEDATGSAEAAGLTLHALADGLGGHEDGEVGARLAVERCLSLFRTHASLDPGVLTEMILTVHRALATREGASRPDGLRATLVILVLSDSAARWAHVGDSRLYHFRAGRVRSRTRDHSVPEMLHRAGEIREDEIRDHPDRNRLLQALGQETAPRVAISDAVPLERGDAFLLCSDGWWENVREAEMETALRGAGEPAAWLARMQERIEADARRSQDNYTAVAVLIG